MLWTAAGCSEPGKPTRPNIVLISMDTTRADHLGCYGHEGIQTPVIDALAESSLRFEHCFAPVPITLPSHASMLSGQYPIRHSVRDNGTFTVPDHLPTLATILGDQGWRTVGVIGAYPLSADFGFARGFQDWDETFTSRQEDILPLAFDQRTADQVTAVALGYLEGTRREPFFLFVHYYDPHRPWTAPALYGRRYRGSPYDAEIAYTDMAIGRLLDGLRTRGHLDNAIVVLTADHGEGLGDHEEDTHSYLIYNETTRVPLLLSGPNVEPGLVQRPVSLVDIAPTILELVGIEPPEKMDGNSLLRGDADPRPVFLESLAGRLHHGWNDVRGVVADDHKYIIGTGTQLFDLDDDMHEQRDLSEEKADLAARLDRTLREFIASNQGPISLEKAFSKADPDVQRRLEALGYVVDAGDDSEMDWSELGPITDDGDPRPHMGIVEIQSLTRALISQGEIPLAMEAIEQGLQRHPEDIELIRLLITARLRAGDGEGAAAASERLQAITKIEPRDDLLCAQAAMAVGDSDAALVFSERAAEVSGQPKELRFHARVLVRTGRTEEGFRILQQIVDSNPCDTEALHDLAGIQRSLSDRTATETTYRRILECAPRDPSPLVNLGNLAVEDGDLDTARAFYLRATKMAPGYALGHYSLGVVLLESGDPAAARRSLREALSRAPVNSRIGRNAAELLQQVEDADEE